MATAYGLEESPLIGVATHNRPAIGHIYLVDPRAPLAIRRSRRAAYQSIAAIHQGSQFRHLNQVNQESVTPRKRMPARTGSMP